MSDLLSELLKLMSKQGASDLYLKVGSSPMLRIEGEMVSVKVDKLTPEQTQSTANELMNEIQKVKFVRNPEINLIHSVPGIGRFRVNIYKQR